MKFFKKLFITIIVLAVIIGGAAVALYIVFSDDETAGLKYTETSFNLENELANDIDTSLGVIKSSNYETNEIVIDLETEQLNRFLIDTIKEKVNDQYDPSTGHIFEKDGLTVDSVYFASSGTDLQLFACAGYKTYFKTAVRLSADISVAEGNQLVIKLNDVMIGKYVNLDSKTLNSLMGSFSSYLSSANIDGLDLEKLTYTIDLNKVVSEAMSSNKFMRDMFCALTFKADIKDKKIRLHVDTSSVFTGHREVPATEDYTFDTTEITTQLALNGSYTVELNEAQFNKLAVGDLDKTIGTFGTSLDFGGKSFTLSCSNPYYKIAKGQVEASLSMNEVEATAAFIADIAPENEGEYLKCLNISAGLASMGDLNFGDLESADGFQYDFKIDAESLCPVENTKIKDFAVNKEQAKVSFSIVPAI